MLRGTPALNLAIAGWTECVEKGYGDGTLAVHASHRALLAWVKNGRDDLPVGVLTFTAEEGRVWIYQSYVVPEFRGRGVYSALWGELVETAVREKMKTIESGVSAKNTAMRRVAAKMGRVENCVVLTYDLTDVDALVVANKT